MTLRTTFAALAAALTLVACDDAPLPTDQNAAVESTPLMQLGHESPRVAGNTIQNLDVLGSIGAVENAAFTGRIVDLTLERVGDDILASGRLVGRLTADGSTQQINEVFQGVTLPVLDESLVPIVPNGGLTVCPILFLELGPIFLDLLGLIVEVPDPIVVEIRAETGPGRLLGNLLCALLGILD